MIREAWGQMLARSITDPASVARALLSLGLARHVLWTGLVLAAVLNTLIFSLSNMLFAGGMGVMPGLFGTPVGYLVMMLGGLVLTVAALTLAGRMLGGQGRLDDVLVVVLWLQVLRVLVQIVTLILALAIPALAVMGVFVATLVGLYIMVHFVNQAHRLESLPKAAGVLLLSVLLMAVALYLLIALVGGTILGTTAHV